MNRMTFLFLVPFVAALVLPATARGGEKVPESRKPFLEALNALEFKRLEGFLHEVPVRDAVRFVARVSGIQIAVPPDVDRKLASAEVEGKSILTFRDRLRFTREKFEWNGLHARQILSDLARRHAFQLEFDPDAFDGAEDAVPPSVYAKVLGRLRTKSVELDHVGVTLERVAKDLGAAGPISIRLGGDLPDWVLRLKRNFYTGRILLETAIHRVAKEFQVKIAYERGEIVFTGKAVRPLPWKNPRGFWVFFSGELSAEQALRKALVACNPRLGLRYKKGRWIVGQFAAPIVVPWEKELPGHVNLRLFGNTALAVLESLLAPHDLGLFFPGGKPTVLPLDAAESAVPRPEISYSLSFLRGSYENFPGHFPELGKTGHGGGPGSWVGGPGEEYSAREMRERVFKCVLEMILEKGFGERAGNTAELSGNRLKVLATPDRQEKVATLLKELRRFHRRAVKVSFHFLNMDAGLMKRLIGSGRLSWGALKPEQRAMLEAGLKNGGARSIKRTSLIAFNGQKANASAVRQKTYVRDYDVEVAQAAQIGDPIIGSIREGMVAEVTPVFFGDGEWLLLDVRTAVAKVLDPIEGFETPHGIVSLPKVDFQRIATSLFIRDGGAVLVGGTGNMGVGKNLVLLLGVKTLVERESDLFGATDFHGRRLRVFDIRDLTHHVPDRKGPKVGITLGYEGAAAPMYEEMQDSYAGERYDPDDLVEMVLERIDPASWDEGRNGIGLALGNIVAVNTRENLDKVEAFLASCRQRRMKGVEVVTRFLSLNAEALAGVLGEGSKEEGSAALTGAQLRKILDLADREEKSRLSASTFVLLNKQRASMQMGRSIPYIRDVDVEVAQMAATSDPITGRLLEGVFLDYRAELDAGEQEVTLEIRPTIARLKKMVVVEIGGKKEKKKDEKDQDENGEKHGLENWIKIPLGRIMLPELELQKIRTTLTLKNGATALVYCPAEAGMETGNDLVLLISVRTAGTKEK